MFLVYIDGFMSSNPSWHQPNPRYQQQQQQQRWCHHMFMVPTTRGTTLMAPTPWHLPGHQPQVPTTRVGTHPIFMSPTPGPTPIFMVTNPTSGTNNNKYYPLLWYQQQGYRHPSLKERHPLIFMVPTTKIRGVIPSAYGLGCPSSFYGTNPRGTTLTLTLTLTLT